MRLTAGRVARLLAVVSLSAAVVLIGGGLDLRLHRTQLVTGWLLGSLVLLLTTFTLRKKVPFLPLGRASTWLRVHSVLGVVSLALFGVHTGWRLPNGLLEGALATVYLAVAGSGLLGLWLSRSLARRLATRGQEVIYERIPALRLKIRREADALALAAAGETGSTAVAEFYTQRLVPFFERPRNLTAHLMRSDRPRRQVLAEMAGFERYLSERDRENLHTLRDLVGVKDDLDYHLALQGALKAWLFVHVPLSWALLLLAAAHGTLAQVFTAGWR